MAVQTEQISVEKMILPHLTSDGEIYYPETNGEEMGETAIHYKLIHYLFGCLQMFLTARSDVFIGANLMLYYEEGNPRTFVVPDLMIVFGVGNQDRSSYRVWEEKQFPQIVIEVASESTYENDLGKKYAEYGRLGAMEYYLLDPENAYLPSPIMAYQRDDDRLRLKPSTDGRVSSPLLGLDFVQTPGGSIRLFDPAGNEFLRTLQEAESENKRLRAELAKLKQLN